MQHRRSIRLMSLVRFWIASISPVGVACRLQEQEAVVALKIVGHLEAMWDSEGSGVWESRADPRQYTYLKVMAWVAFDRFIRQYDAPRAAVESDPRFLERVRALRSTVHEQVCREGWNEGLGSFTQHYGGQETDASLLLLPLVGFLPVHDPRMAATIATIQRELSEGGLIRQTGLEAMVRTRELFSPVLAGWPTASVCRAAPRKPAHNSNAYSPSVMTSVCCPRSTTSQVSISPVIFRRRSPILLLSIRRSISVVRR